MQRNAHAPIRYRIVVRGHLGERFSALFDDLDHQSGSGESVFVGRFDQAGLHGVLDQLRALGIELVSVNALERPVPFQQEARR